MAQNAEAIERGVLALDVKLGDAPEGAYVRDWSINGVDAVSYTHLTLPTT